MTDTRIHLAERLISDFAARTGLDGHGNARIRYLWTDAFAVFALAGLFRHTQNPQYIDWMRRLIKLVHSVLGRYRPDDSRKGWISGLSNGEGERHPTAGGLRIGKQLPELAPDEPYDPSLEWERDGQYLHYLTKWMQALNCASSITGEPQFRTWAIELAQVAHRRFLYQPRPGAPKRLFWKMNVDLSRPVVPSMGQLDPLDCYVTFTALSPRLQSGVLTKESADMRSICKSVPTWETTDALGIGGLLTESATLVQLIASGDIEFDVLVSWLLRDAQRSLETYVTTRELALPPAVRLAFRELGLSIGLHCVEPMRVAVAAHPERFNAHNDSIGLLDHIAPLEKFSAISETVESFWSAVEAQHSSSWTEHLDINTVMLATSLVPDALTQGVENGVAAGSKNSHTVIRF